MNIIGLDISKETIDCRIWKNGQAGEHIKIQNNISGFLQLKDRIKQRRIRKCLIAMEATGIYYEAAADYLSRHYPVTVINPLKIKDYGKSQFNRTKTDKADAALIAEYAGRHSDKLDYYTTPHPQQYKLAKLATLMQQLKLQIAQQKNRIAVSTDPFVKSIQRDLLQTLQKHLNSTIEEIHTVIDQSQTEQSIKYKNLLTIPGISDQTAPIIFNTLETKPFAKLSQFIAYAGLSPKIEQSGTSVDKKSKMGKYGHKRLKAAFFWPAMTAYRLKLFPKFIETLQAAGKPKMVIIGALMRKIAKICYYIHKSNKPFEIERYRQITP